MRTHVLGIAHHGAMGFGVSLFLLATACGNATDSRGPSEPFASVPDINVSGAARAKALEPRLAPHTASKLAVDSFGKGRARIVTKDHPGGASPHSFWAERLDIDGSGEPSLVDLAWDSPHRVLYIS